MNFAGYETIDDLLLNYTRYSRRKNVQVGRLVLYLFGYRDPERQALSDLICSA